MNYFLVSDLVVYSLHVLIVGIRFCEKARIFFSEHVYPVIVSSVIRFREFWDEFRLKINEVGISISQLPMVQTMRNKIIDTDTDIDISQVHAVAIGSMIFGVTMILISIGAYVRYVENNNTEINEIQKIMDKILKEHDQEFRDMAHTIVMAHTNELKHLNNGESLNDPESDPESEVNFDFEKRFDQFEDKIMMKFKNTNEHIQQLLIDVTKMHMHILLIYNEQREQRESMKKEDMEEDMEDPNDPDYVSDSEDSEDSEDEKPIRRYPKRGSPKLLKKKKNE
jgi:hypothetical protein